MREYQGEGFTITYEVSRCIHAQECVHRLPRVFDPEQRPWIEPGAADSEEIARVVAHCPTGALRLRGGPPEPVPTRNIGTLSPNGPIYLRGDILLTVPGGPVHQETRVALCRCGQSAHKPLCDNAHRESRFSDRGVLKTAGGEPAGEGKLAITAAPDGPLLVQGPLELRAAGGGQTLHTERTALCRCGASKEKPFCDGSHLTIGFRSD